MGEKDKLPRYCWEKQGVLKWMTFFVVFDFTEPPNFFHSPSLGSKIFFNNILLKNQTSFEVYLNNHFVIWEKLIKAERYDRREITKGLLLDDCEFGETIFNSYQKSI